MTLQKSHDRLYPLVAVPSELPQAVPQADVSGDIKRTPAGRFADSASAKAAGAAGGRARAKQVRLARSLGLSGTTSNPAFAPYLASAASFREHHTSGLAALCGGSVGSGPCSMIASASLQLAASRFLFDQAQDAAGFKSASNLADASRQNLLAAYELGVREAKARAENGEDSIELARAAFRKGLGQ